MFGNKTVSKKQWYGNTKMTLKIIVKQAIFGYNNIIKKYKSLFCDSYDVSQ
jgi:hypothetical protein